MIHQQVIDDINAGTDLGERIWLAVKPQTAKTFSSDDPQVEKILGPKFSEFLVDATRVEVKNDCDYDFAQEVSIYTFNDWPKVNLCIIEDPYDFPNHDDFVWVTHRDDSSGNVVMAEGFKNLVPIERRIFRPNQPHPTRVFFCAPGARVEIRRMEIPKGLLLREEQDYACFFNDSERPEGTRKRLKEGQETRFFYRTESGLEEFFPERAHETLSQQG